jgi:hypothetical protein
MQFETTKVMCCISDELDVGCACLQITSMAVCYSSLCMVDAAPLVPPADAAEAQQLA